MMPPAAHPPSPPSRAVFQTETPVHALVSQLRAVVEMAGPAEKREVCPGEPEHLGGRGAAAAAAASLADREPGPFQQRSLPLNKKINFVPK